MKGITFRHVGNFSKMDRFLARLMNREYLNILDKYGQKGVNALAAATPKRTGLTAASWTYEITHNLESSTISWKNTNVNKGVNIAIILQYGHGTRNGGYVAGRDYINPAIQPIFDQMAVEAWKEVVG